jgi:hypothetical protein
MKDVLEGWEPDPKSASSKWRYNVCTCGKAVDEGFVETCPLCDRDKCPSCQDINSFLKKDFGEYLQAPLCSDCVRYNKEREKSYE